MVLKVALPVCHFCSIIVSRDTYNDDRIECWSDGGSAIPAGVNVIGCIAYAVGVM